MTTRTTSSKESLLQIQISSKMSIKTPATLTVWTDGQGHIDGHIYNVTATGIKMKFFVKDVTGGSGLLLQLPYANLVSAIMRYRKDV
ncbi:MAG TPA: hypothetical protein VGO47_12605 [Chlamydiales bacterium]|nr:hypothetical protein [Chlamydiales bacterium]